MKRKDKVLTVIGEKVKYLRQETGLSQEAFALEHDFDRTYYGRIERGEKNISALILAKIALALYVEISEFFPTKKELKAIMNRRVDTRPRRIKFSIKENCTK